MPSARGLEPPVGPNPALCLGSEGTPGTALGKGLTLSDAFANAWAERSCSQMCSQTADFADVRECSPASKSLVALRIRSLANSGERVAEDWGSRGRRFKSCHPDGKPQVRGRFGQKGVSILVPLTAICRAPAQDGGLGQRESYHSLRTVSPKGT